MMTEAEADLAVHGQIGVLIGRHLNDLHLCGVGDDERAERQHVRANRGEYQGTEGRVDDRATRRQAIGSRAGRC